MLKTLERALEADLILVVLDSSERAAPPFPPGLLEKFKASTTIIVLNKTDLAPDAKPSFTLPGAAVVAVSALSGLGIDDLQAAIVGLADKEAHNPQDMVAINARHANALTQAQAWLAAAERKLIANEPMELVASDLRGVMGAFGEITGRIDNERMFDRLFATFCIGK